MKILITGASGFIGRNLKEHFAKIYTVKTPNHSEVELCDEKCVFKYLKKNSFDIIIHAATHNATKTSTKDRSQVLSTNVRMFFNLVKHKDLFGRMFYFGSGAEFDREHYIPHMPEDYFDRYIPTDDYGFSKYIMNRTTREEKNIYNLRLFGCFGRYEDWRIRFISNACCYAVLGKTIPIHQNITIDYLYINDLVKIVQKFLHARDIPHKDYNVCTGRGIDLINLAKLVIAASGKNITYTVLKKGKKKEYTGDNKRLLAFTGDLHFTPHTTAVMELYDWYKRHKKLIERSHLL